MNRVGCQSVATMLFLAAVSSGHAQMILVGSTVSTTPLGAASTLVDIDVISGVASNSRSLGISDVAGIAVQPGSGVLFGLTTFGSSPHPNSLIVINPVTGGVAVVGSTGLTGIVEGDLAFNPITGTLYGVQTGIGLGVERNIFHLNPSTGVGTVIGPTGSIGDLSALAFSPQGELFALDTSGNGNSLLLRLDPDTGLVFGSQALNVDLHSAAGMTFDPLSGTAYISDRKPATSTNVLYRLNLVTSHLEEVGPLGLTTHGIAGLAFVTIPEPSSCALLLLGSVGAGPVATLLGRRRRWVKSGSIREGAERVSLS